MIIKVSTFDDLTFFFCFLRVVSEAKKPLIIRLPVKQSFSFELFCITKFQTFHWTLYYLQAKKPTHVATTPCSSWGRVNPEALVGRRVCVRMDGEDEFEVLVIKEFNAKDVIKQDPFPLCCSLSFYLCVCSCSERSLVFARERIALRL